MKKTLFAILAFVAVFSSVSCGDEERMAPTEWPSSFKSLMLDYKEGRCFESAVLSQTEAIISFTDDSKTRIPLEEVKVFDAVTGNRPILMCDRKTGHWTLNGKATPFVKDESLSDAEAMPLCLYFDEHCLYMALSNGVTLVIGCGPERALESFVFEPMDNPGLLETIVCDMDLEVGTLVGPVPVFATDLRLAPRFVLHARGISVDGEPQIGGISKQDFSEPVEYVVELFNGDLVSFTVSLSKEAAFPTVVIQTKGNLEVVEKDKYIEGTIGLHDFGKLYSEDETVQGSMSIKGRGNSTWGMEKKPYRIKMDEKTSFLGLQKNKNWVLLASYSDKSLLRDMVARELSRICGMRWTPALRPVELYFNGTFRGVYLLGEHKEVQEGRVDIAIVGEEDNQGDALTGGYYFELEQQMDEATCFWTETYEAPVMFSDPEVPTPEQLSYVKQYFRDFERALRGDTFADPEKGYAKYIDVPSFINYYIIQEVMKNVDGNLRKSCFLTKERGGKLEMFHIWDFDLTLGNCDYINGEFPGATNTFEGFFIKDFGRLGKGTGWYCRLFEDPAFKAAVKSRWKEVYPRMRTLPKDFIEPQAEILAKSAAKNFERWDILGKEVWPNLVVPGSYEGEVRYLVDFYSRRLDWLNSRINSW